MRKALATIVAVTVAFLSTTGSSWAQRKAEPGTFDYYVLSLSWSPTYCAKEESQGNPDQCGVDRKFGFVVHGLWPQYSAGGYPANCTRDRSVPKAVVDQTMPIMPSVGLIVHQWQKHGTCTGLNATDYFARIRTAYEKVKIPAEFHSTASGLSVPATQVERLFVQANPGLTPESVAVVCSKRDVAEVRLCMDKDLGFVACGEKVVDRCRRDAILSAAR
ncbi:ribonuclease T2 family protein [Azospirillum soli]|uniref:ribonuclease T2 family protein n=1 Tax=Azospirillum soli TaxID=1304799 RepID=UPI001AEB742D|nr:ribonuclease T [Azospirillum soli]MBP2311172.1 ribonuclease T2 [Azospirillum soli]